jgi:chromosome segregation ATPase
MAEEVNINISITTNAAPVASKITKELQGVRKEAKAVKEDLKGVTEPVKQGTKDFETLKKSVSPIKGLISDLTGGMSDAFFQAFESVKAATAGVKGLDLALKTAAFGIAILLIQGIIKLYDELVQTEEEEAEALKAATEAKKKYIDETRAAADAIDKERKARSEGANELKREVSELEASGAASEKIYSKRKELLEKEKLDLIAKQAFLFDDAEAQKDIAQQILDKESEIRALDLSNQKSNNDKKKEDAKKAAQDRFDILNRETQDTRGECRSHCKRGSCAEHFRRSGHC